MEAKASVTTSLPALASSTPTEGSTALVSTFVDEHTPIALLSRTLPLGSTLYIEAGAGAGKTTCAETIISVNKVNSNGIRQQLLATTMTKAGVNEMKSKPHIPNSIVKSLHGLGFNALTSAYSHRMSESLKRQGILRPGESMEIRTQTTHSSKYQLMAQTLMPATILDKQPQMHMPGPVSAAYELLVDFVDGLATKAMENGLGQPGNPEICDVEELERLVTRYELGVLIERRYANMSLELQLIADGSVAVVLATGVDALSGPEAALKEVVNDLPNPLKTRTPKHRQDAGVAVTVVLLAEAIKVAMQPVWRGKNLFKNALIPSDLMYLPSVKFCEMVSLPANVAVQAPIVARNGRKYDLILVDEAQDSNKAQAGLVKWAMAPHTQLVIFGDPRQRCFSFASASADALNSLLQPRENGVLERRVLSNNFRCSRLICEEVQKVLIEMKCDRIVRPVRPDDGEIIRNANLRNGELQAWMAQGPVAILARLNSVLAAFSTHFLKVGQPYAMLAKQGVLPQLLCLLNSFSDDVSLSTLVLELRNQVASNKKLTLAEKDVALCLAIFASSLLPDITSVLSAKNRLSQHLNQAFKGSSDTANNAKVRGMPILANGHAAKGHEFDTVIIAEPSMMTVQKIIDAGGEEVALVLDPRSSNAALEFPTYPTFYISP